MLQNSVVGCLRAGLAKPRVELRSGSLPWQRIFYNSCEIFCGTFVFFESKMCVSVTCVLRVRVYVFVFVCLCFCVSLSQCVCLSVRVSVCGCVYVCVCVCIVQVCSGAFPSRKCVCALLQVQGSWSTTGGWRGEKGWSLSQDSRQGGSRKGQKRKRKCLFFLTAVNNIFHGHPHVIPAPITIHHISIFFHSHLHVMSGHCTTITKSFPLRAFLPVSA